MLYVMVWFSTAAFFFFVTVSTIQYGMAGVCYTRTLQRYCIKHVAIQLQWPISLVARIKHL
jgi:hypothetical protein